MLSTFLKSRIQDCKDLVMELRKTFSYVSVLGTDVKVDSVSCNRKSSSIADEGFSSECGFVVKMKNEGSFFEYSLCDITGDKVQLAKTILEASKISEALKNTQIKTRIPDDEPMEKSFSRESDFSEISLEERMSFIQSIKDKVLTLDECNQNVSVSISTLQVSKIFVTENKTLDQYYTWVNGRIILFYGKDGEMITSREDAYAVTIREVMNTLSNKIEKVQEKARHLINAKPITPGVYDVITDASISGLIAHEAFGHGVEMDQFVKDRALAKSFVGKYVASPIVNMRDGAASTISAASYFFDDDGVLAHDTQIIKDGILVSGISDMASALQLGTVPTGNGRREDYSHKAYTRMTNTFFDAGTDKLEDMIASISHGYFICETNNGMEDPKNWAIQCTAEYGIEIVDGKLTDNYVSPVVLSGYVPDLLKSITMISDDLKVEGSGGCGKGYKEWVRVTSGGPNLKARVKLG